VQDVRVSLRRLLRSPGATAAGIIALACGIGLNVAAFVALRALVLHPLPFPEIHRIAWVSEANPTLGSPRNNVSGTNFVEWRRQSRVFQAMGAFTYSTVNWTGAEGPEELHACRATPAFFEALGVRMRLGRWYTAEGAAGADTRAAVISERLWQTRFAEDPSIIGAKLRLDEEPRTIVGVVAEGFEYPPETAVWLPLDPKRTGWSRNLFVVGRLRSGASLEEAKTEMATIAARLERENPAHDTGWSARVEPFLDIVSIGTSRLVLLQALAAGFVLLLACANLANVLLAQTLTRRRELGIRTAMGATRARLVRLVLVEAMLLALAGGALAVPLAASYVGILRSLVPIEQYRWLAGVRHLVAGAETVAIAFGLSLLAGMLCAVPSLVDARRRHDLGGTFRGEARGAPLWGQTPRLRTALIVVEVGLAFALLAGAGAMVSAHRRATAVDLGYEPRGLVTASVSLLPARYDSAQAALAYFDEALHRLKALPSVEVAALAGGLSGGTQFGTLRAHGQQAPRAGTRPPRCVYVSPGFFRAMRIPLRAGRVFSKEDAAARPPRVAIVSEGVARAYWIDGASPVGREYTGSYSPHPMRVIGVVGELHGLFDQPTVYLPLSAGPPLSVTLLARAAGDSAPPLAAVRTQIEGIDPLHTITRVQTMDRRLGGQAWDLGLAATQAQVFALLALLLAVSGVYGVVRFWADRRRREMGVRVALGARDRDVVALVVVQAMRWVGAGLALGLAASLLLQDLVSKAVHGMSPGGSATAVVAAALLILATFVAAYLPARRAARLNPAQVLRHE